MHLLHIFFVFIEIEMVGQKEGDKRISSFVALCRER